LYAIVLPAGIAGIGSSELPPSFDRPNAFPFLTLNFDLLPDVEKKLGSLSFLGSTPARSVRFEVLPLRQRLPRWFEDLRGERIGVVRLLLLWRLEREEERGGVGTGRCWCGSSKEGGVAGPRLEDIEDGVRGELMEEGERKGVVEEGEARVAREEPGEAMLNCFRKVDGERLWVRARGDARVGLRWEAYGEERKQVIRRGKARSGQPRFGTGIRPEENSLDW
jgi:hypothetical protein